MVRLSFQGVRFHTSGSRSARGSIPLHDTTIIKHFRKAQHGQHELMQQLGAHVIYRWRRGMPAYGSFEMENDGRCRCLRNEPLLRSLLRRLACIEFDDLERKDRRHVLERVLNTGYAFLRGNTRCFRKESRELRQLLSQLADEQCPDVCVVVSQLDGAELAEIITTCPE